MYGYVISVLVLLTLVTSLQPVRRLRPVQRWLVACVAIGVVITPISDISLVTYCRSFFGDLSVTTLLLLSMWSYSNITGYTSPKTLPKSLCKTILAALVLVFYPMSLGASLVDPYWLGYQPQVLIISTLIVGIFASLCRSFFIVLIVVCVQFAYSLKMMESSNYWDYLFDPVVALYCIVCLPAAVKHWAGAIDLRTIALAPFQPGVQKKSEVS